MKCAQCLANNATKKYKFTSYINVSEENTNKNMFNKIVSITAPVCGNCILELDSLGKKLTNYIVEEIKQFTHNIPTKIRKDINIELK